MPRNLRKVLISKFKRVIVDKDIKETFTFDNEMPPETLSLIKREKIDLDEVLIFRQDQLNEEWFCLTTSGIHSGKCFFAYKDLIKVDIVPKMKNGFPVSVEELELFLKKERFKMSVERGTYAGILSILQHFIFNTHWS